MMNSENIFSIKYNQEIPDTGKLLIAEPFLTDYPFSRSVVLLVNHSLESSMGIILNVPMHQSLNDIITDLKGLENIPLYRGGPLGEDILFFIHSHSHIPAALPITNKLYLNGDFDIVKELLLEGKVEPNDFRFFLGYSGWGPEQLQNELKTNTWLVTEEPAEYIINQSAKLLWKNILHNMGYKYKLWARYPLVPSQN
ncbi:UPF0301 protein yqgE [Bacteroides coprosuis DSM 18011]|uniref:UPF0301 protein Bcop_0907 n=1 Tax=Bacteroides coprosuis DSM 18011 TaxID=679937 RepID=F3ZU17_9BACE|nr:YqgE/AlgH family protein [Bacteroides coprosuis]EGJ71118.1 UPF0301 protein yqgE [Bacteroides coprosuis DSM 18011]HJD91306.1 YqgE/AlgH family protein [Bacteroides coprosuis]